MSMARSGATNCSLAAAVRDGRFREDLYHRLAVVTLRVPPLRERGEDIGRLAEHFLARACAGYGVAPKTLTPEAIRSAVRTVLSSAAYRTHAERLRDEMAALPSLEHAVVLLERLAIEKVPLIGHQ